MILNYNVHNIFKFRVITTNKKYIKYLEKEYSFFKVRELENPDLIVIIGKFKPNNKNCNIINHKYYVKKDYIFCKDSYKVVKWSVQIFGLERKKTIVHFDGNLFADSFLCRYIIEPLMRFKTCQKGYSFLHSSGISDGKWAFLFLACKGVGKTSTALHIINEGGIYLSDDFTILSKNATVYSYPTTIHLFEYNLKDCPFVYNKLSLKQKIETKLKDYLYKLTMGYAQLPLDINVQEIFKESKIGRSYPLKALFFLQKTNKDDVEIKENIDKHKVADKIIPINKFEAFHFFDYMLAYSYVFPKSKVASHWTRLHANILAALKKTSCYEVQIPKKYTFKTFKALKNLLIKNDYKYNKVKY